MNKKKTYILLVTVLAIWGTIGYKIINGINPNIEEDKQQTINVAFKAPSNTEIDTFSIKNATRDPFLGTLSNSKKINTKSTKTNIKTKLPKNSPSINYTGLVKKQNSAEKVFVVNINNKQYLLKQGQTIDSVTLVKGNTKQIVMRYQNKLQTVKRQ